ncbi:MAG: glycogen synthase GlgA [Candidatus Eremiobacteraeota bacterium]|nr:glycogen synthase GlgA [Candidatus Eremiobacteraeota bacterium]
MAKTGGLADVAAALPVALRDAGVDMRLIMPAYPLALSALSEAQPVCSLGDVHQRGETRVLAAQTPDSGLTLYLIANEAMFARDGEPYQDAGGQAWADNADRFALFCAAVSLFAQRDDADWRPDVIHCNDWHTGLIPALCTVSAGAGKGTVPAHILTIHNAAFQEPLSTKQFGSYGVPSAAFSSDLVAQPSFLAVGIKSARRITTVSPTYAKELQTPEFGVGLERLIAARASVLSGIVNGIDETAWNPREDAAIAQNYDENDFSGKAICKLALLEEFGLFSDDRAPLLGCVSRLTWQKGIDVLLECLPELLRDGARFVLLGTGDSALESRLTQLAQQFPREAAVRIAYDEQQAHRVVAGADVFVMPSRFEPCGLNQMYSQRYGTVPVVNPVGGLADTVIDVMSGPAAAATGFCLPSLGTENLAATIREALLRRRDTDVWRLLQCNGMLADFGWARSARAYREVYDSALSPH